MKTRGLLYTDDLTSASRTLLWCWILGEPTIIAWGKDNVAQCACCRGNPFDTPKLHEFLGRVARPGGTAPPPGFVSEPTEFVSLSILYLAAAEAVARQAHDGATEVVTGDPYIRHVERVVARVIRDDEKAVAWLHDVLEDTPAWTRARLCAYGVFPDDVLDAVDLLTRCRAEPYDQYIGRIAEDVLARAVKIADLQDHLRPNCPASLRPRYERALGILVE